MTAMLNKSNKKKLTWEKLLYFVSQQKWVIIQEIMSFSQDGFQNIKTSDHDA